LNGTAATIRTMPTGVTRLIQEPIIAAANAANGRRLGVLI